jgi:uncharacterized membrane protein YbhN (UPF0104 family)
VLRELPATGFDQAPRLRGTRWQWWLGAALVACVALAAARSVDWTRIADATANVKAQPLVVPAAAALYAVAFLLRSIAWRLLMPSRPPLRDLVSNLHASLFLNHVLPFKAGEFARPLLAERHGVPGREAVATTAVARTLDFAALVCIAVATVPVAAGLTGLGLAILATGVAVSAAASGLVVLRFAPFAGETGLRRRLAAISDGLRAIPAPRIALAAPIVVASWLLEAGMVWSAALLLDQDITVRMAVGVTAATVACQAVHLTPGGLGLYEAAMTAALVSFGMPAQDALAVAVVSHGLKYAYSLAVGGPFALGEAVFLLRGRAGEAVKAASAIEVTAARLWNVLNEGKPFTPVFTSFVVFAWWGPGALSGGNWLRLGLAAATIIPLSLVFWRFPFPLRLRTALWLYLALFVALTQSVPTGPILLALGLYFAFTVVLWGTVYYHLRIGTKWSNGFRFARLVFENPDPTSGNFLEQAPKVFLLVCGFAYVANGNGATPSVLVLVSTAFIGLSALLVHRWFFTWPPALPQPRRSVAAPPSPAAGARRVIAIVIDGCRADRLLEANTPCIDRLRAEGADFRAMSTVYPARTVTCFSSMLTGAGPEQHGMASNFVPDLGVKCESVFDVLREAGKHGALVGIAHLVDAFGNRDVRPVTAVMDNDEIDGALVREGQRVLLEEDPDLLVLQLLSVDQTGHARGSYNAEYLAKVEETDARIDAFLRWCGERGFLEGATVILTADHGQGIGIGGHGYMTPPEVTIPCVLWGAGVPRLPTDFEPRFITDIAATICAQLGLRAPRASVGRDLLAARTPEHQRPVVFVMPARNEAANLASVFASIAATAIEPRRVIVVDDGSTDPTGEVARALGADVVRHDCPRGLGAAVRTGLAVARGREPPAVVDLDADGEYDGSESAKLLAPILSGEADYVLGKRTNARAGGMTFSRRVANRFFSIGVSVCAGRWVSDAQTGFRAFSPRAADVAEIVHDYNYAQVLTLNLLHKGMRMKEVPISYRRRGTGRSFVRAEYLWRAPLGMAREMLRG